MNCLNGARYLQEALQSVLAQTYQDWELIFWDDRSTDASAEILLAVMGEDPRVRYFCGQGGQPLGTSRNLALEKCEGRYVALLDCDDLWGLQKLATQIWKADTAGETCGLLSSNCVLIGPDGRALDLAFRRCPVPVQKDTYTALLEGPNFIPSPTILWRTDALRKVGGFEPTYRYAETFAACLRVARIYDVLVDLCILAEYRLHDGQRGGTGCAGMTREVLREMRLHRGQAGWRQYLREVLLWARYGGQLLASR